MLAYILNLYTLRMLQEALARRLQRIILSVMIEQIVYLVHLMASQSSPPHMQVESFLKFRFVMATLHVRFFFPAVVGCLK